MKARNQILSAVEIGGAEAAWVLAAHLYATLVPLALCVAVYAHWDYLTVTTHNPFLFYVAVGLFCAGSAFEVAQNAVDKWYLTPESASANGAGFCDFLFYLMVTAGQAVCAMAIAGGTWWVHLIGTCALIAFPVLYFAQVGHFVPLTITNLLVVILAYNAFGDPIIFMQVLLVGVTMYFFTMLLKTGAQSIHGLTTVAASSGVWFLVWALHNGATGHQTSWALTSTIFVAAVIVGVALWPAINRLRCSDRIERCSPGHGQ
jgi:hypothetical protein